MKGIHMFCFEYGNSNVYAQLGFADAEEIPLKANIVKDITHSIRASGLKVSEAATLLDTGSCRDKAGNDT
ncbi:hypothetical protein D9M69_301040 [compost metagenome]